jgi:hypothetical protein
MTKKGISIVLCAFFDALHTPGRVKGKKEDEVFM